MSRAFYLRPGGILAGPAAGRAVSAGTALPLAGGRLAFAHLERLVRRPDGGADRQALPLSTVSGDEEFEPVLRLLGRARPGWAGFTWDRPLVMGIVNVTPDSFSDGGDCFDPGRAVAHGLAHREAGADILDVGGESTRPGAVPVPVEAEIGRVVPVIRALAAKGCVVSIDTRHAAVMAAAVAAGATIVNDVTALSGDPDSLAVAAALGVPVVLMHMRGEPQTMLDAAHYLSVTLDVFDHLSQRVAACEAAGMRRERIVIDPGIGFAKNLGHNLEILADLALFHGLGCPLLLGASRKRFIGRLSRDEPAKARVPGSLAAGLQGLAQGAQILRVHDVAETVQAVRVFQAIREAA
jgi:dihydropteroate synthase